MKCRRCDNPADYRCLYCAKCRKENEANRPAQQRDRMREVRAKDRATICHAGDRENLQRLAREVGLIR